MARYRYFASQLVYRDEKGRRIPDADVRAAVDQVASKAADRMAGLTSRLRAGGLSLDAWTGAMAGEIKQAHLAIAMIGHGGRQAMTPARWGYLGRVIRDEYAWLRGFAVAVANDTAGSDKQIVARSRMYAATAALSFEHARDRDAIAAGFDQERNQLGAAESCAECRDLRALGWVPAGTLPAVGSRTCRQNCACTIQRRKSAQQRQEAA